MWLLWGAIVPDQQTPQACRMGILLVSGRRLRPILGALGHDLLPTLSGVPHKAVNPCKRQYTPDNLQCPSPRYTRGMPLSPEHESAPATLYVEGLVLASEIQADRLVALRAQLAAAFALADDIRPRLDPRLRRQAVEEF